MESSSSGSIPPEVSDSPVKWQWYLFLIPVVLVFFALVYLVWRLTLSRRKAKRRQSILRNVHLVQADIEKDRQRLERGGSVVSRISRMASTKSRRNSTRRSSDIPRRATVVSSTTDEKNSIKASIPQDFLPDQHNEKKPHDTDAPLDPVLVAEEGADPDAISADASAAPVTRPSAPRRNDTNALSVIGEGAASETNGSPQSQPEAFVSDSKVEEAVEVAKVEALKDGTASASAASGTAPVSHASPFDDDQAALSSAHSHSPSTSLSHSASLTRSNMRALSQREASAATTASSGQTHVHSSPSTSMGTLAMATAPKSLRSASGTTADADQPSSTTSTDVGPLSSSSNPFATPITSAGGEAAATAQPEGLQTPKRGNVVWVREPVPRRDPSPAAAAAVRSPPTESISAAAGEAQKKRRGSTDAWISKTGASASPGAGEGGLKLKRSLSLLTSNALRRSSTSNSSLGGSPAAKGKERGRTQEKEGGKGGLFGLGLVRTRSPTTVTSPEPVAAGVSGKGWTYVPRAGDWASKADAMHGEGGGAGPLSSRLPGATVSASYLPVGVKGTNAGGPSLPSALGGVQQVRSASIGPGAVGGSGEPTWLAGSALARRPSIGVAGSRYKETFDDE